MIITEDYVRFETAKLLKEKGFEGRMHTFYTEDGTDIESSYVVPSNFFPIYRPTLQMAMKWLKEKHKITIGTLFKGDRIYYEIHQNNEFVFGVDTPKSYEEVCEEAIRYCLENLI